MKEKAHPLAAIEPFEQDWKPTDIKGKRYAIYKNSTGILALALDGKILPLQITLIWEQNVNDVVEVTVKFLMDK